MFKILFQTRIPTFLPIGLLWATLMASKETGPFFFCFSLINVVKPSTSKIIWVIHSPKSGTKLAKIKNHPKESNTEGLITKKSTTITKTPKSTRFLNS